MNNAFFILIVFGVLIFLIFVLRKFKTPKLSCMTLVSGGVKTGKSTLAVHFAVIEHKKRVRRVKVRNFFARLLHKVQEPLPLLYSNIPLNCDYVPLTDDLLLRKKRFVFGSTIYVCESSLVADSQLVRDMDINERLLLFNKLIGHSTHGGNIIYDTQCIGDCHYSVKRCLSDYYYIHHLVKFLPFYLVAYVREDRYSEDGTTLNVNDRDTEDTLKKILIPKKVWKLFDCYCYSVLTDDLPVEDTVKHGKGKSLKANKIVSFRHFRSIKNDKE